MTEHVLKTLAPYWDAIADGRKNFEVRRNDRGFQTGDVLVLRRISHGIGFDAEPKELRRLVTYILTNYHHEGIAPGHVVMGLEKEGSS